MSIQPFKSDKDLVKFARKFFRDRVGSFRKDVAICLRADANRHHAYFPALITCIGFLDLLSGLYAGKLDGHGLTELKNYVARFMDGTKYDPLRIDVLYLTFRHKLAHLSFPYVVFDTKTDRRKLADHKHRRITWKVNASKRKLPIELVEHGSPQFLRKTLCEVHEGYISSKWELVAQ
jgi:hypothetical protein